MLSAGSALLVFCHIPIYHHWPLEDELCGMFYQVYSNKYCNVDQKSHLGFKISMYGVQLLRRGLVLINAPAPWFLQIGAFKCAPSPTTLSTSKVPLSEVKGKLPFHVWESQSKTRFLLWACRTLGGKVVWRYICKNFLIMCVC